MADRIALIATLRGFVARWADRPRQRTPGWYKLKEDQEGSSTLKEYAGGLTPAARISRVAKLSGVAARRYFRSRALDWGTVLESFLEGFVELDCGLELHGTDISVPAPEGLGLRGYHSNSPDGYGVVEWYQEGGAWRLLTTEKGQQAWARGRPRRHEIVLFEFKNPISRVPNGHVPSGYLSQLWSGMTLAPLVRRAVFVDGTHRRCSLKNLGPNPRYDRLYHPEAKAVSWKTDAPPVSWGFIAVYAPTASAPVEVRRRVDPDSNKSVYPFDESVRMWADHFRRPFCDGPAGRPEAVDFGQAPPPAFDRVLNFCARGFFRTANVGPCTPDGRGDTRLSTPAGVQEAVDAAARDAPPHHYLLGAIPLKLVRIDYVVEGRNDDFLASISDEIVEVCDLARQIRAAPNPEAAFFKFSEGARKKRPARKEVAFWDDDEGFEDAPVRS